jgi:hypothetical protein
MSDTEFDPMMTTISLAEWLKAKTAYATLRTALCDIEGGIADTIQEAKLIAERAVLSTPPSL